MSVLTLYRDDVRVDEHVLMRAVVSLGRHPDNDIVLDDLALSRFHARVERRGDRYVVVDLGSQNGVFLNGVRISGEAAIRPGDRVGIGRYVGVFNESVDHPVRPGKAAAASPQKAGTHTGPCLVMLHDGNEVDRFALKPDGMVIGRSQRCDVVIGLLALSRRHARVRQGSDGEWYVEDLGSQNGTYLNDLPVTAPAQLTSGDVLNFFEYALMFEADDNTEADAAPLTREAGDEFTARTRALRKPKIKAPKPKPKPKKGDKTFDSANLVSEVIELSLEDVEELSPDFDPVMATRDERLVFTSDQSSADVADIEDEPIEAGPTAAREGRVVRSWPSAPETATALSASQRPASAGRLEVFVDGRIVTEVPLALGAVRVGSDARCDVALPPLAGIAPWHLLVIAIGESVVMMRVGDAPAPRIVGKVVYQSFLEPGDKIDLGRAALVYRV